MINPLTLKVDGVEGHVDQNLHVFDRETDRVLGASDENHLAVAECENGVTLKT